MTQWLLRQQEKRDLAEVRTLGTAMAHPDLTDVIVARVEPGMFRRDAHRVVADAIWSLRRDGKTADLEAVTDRLVGAGHFDTVKGHDGLFGLWQQAEDDVRAVDEMVDLERRRQLWQAFTHGREQVTRPDLEPDDVAAEVVAMLHKREAWDDESGPISTDELLSLDPPEWLVEGVFPAGLSLLFGSPKTAKSYTALQTAWSYATGTPWFRRKCNGPGTVLYLAGEGLSDLKLRVEALVEATDTHPGGHLLWWTEPLSLSRERDAAKLRLAVEQCGAGLVVVDTWRRFSGLVDENDAGKASAAIGALEDLCLRGVSVLVVHHTNAEGGIRGSTALAGAVESAARTIHDPDAGRVVLTSYLARRGVGFRDIRFGWRRSGPDSVLQEVGM